MLLELLQKGYGKAMNLNCAEKILYGANWAYNMQLPPQTLKIADMLMPYAMRVKIVTDIFGLQRAVYADTF